MAQIAMLTNMYVSELWKPQNGPLQMPQVVDAALLSPSDNIFMYT